MPSEPIQTETREESKPAPTVVRAENKKSMIIGSLCFLAYMGCHIGKNILGALMPQILDAMPDAAATLGSMTSVFLLTYGFGQLINGVIGTFLPAKWMVFIGLAASGGIIMLFPVLGISRLGSVLWGVCGFSSSMMWGPIAAMVGENTKEKAAKTILTALTAASLLGALVTYLLAFLASRQESWKPFFALAGVLMLMIALVWLPVCTRMEKKGMLVSARQKRESTPGIRGEERKKLLRVFGSIGFLSMVLATMLNGVIRNATSIWVPTFLSRSLGLSLSAVSLISSLLPLVCISGTFLSLYILRFFRNNEKAECLALFLTSAICFALVLLFQHTCVPIALVALFVAMAGMHGACNMIFSVYVLNFRPYGIISGMSGFLDFASYMSASAASMLFTSLSAKDNWYGVVLCWALCCAAGVVFSLTAQIPSRQEKAEIR